MLFAAYVRIFPHFPLVRLLYVLYMTVENDHLWAADLDEHPPTQSQVLSDPDPRSAYDQNSDFIMKLGASSCLFTWRYTVTLW